MNANLSNVRFQLNVHQRKLLIDGKPTKLGARAFDVLLALVERRGRAVTKDELLDAVWPGTIVEENNLQVQISTLRKLLGPQTISTIPGRGYCLTAEVSTLETPPGPSPSPPECRAPVARQNRLFGRDADISAITELLQEHAHVSIVGAGGIGKTRLAQAVVADRREQFQDGLVVRWVELAALNEGGLVIGAIAQAIGVSAGGEQPLLETVIALLRHENALLVLDNCEHLLDAVADVAQTLIASAPRLRILVTSQEALHTRDEHIYRLAGLPTESTSDAPAAACALFVVCAEAADSRLRLTRANFTTISEICQRLDGMPLAIQLAAARVRLLGIDGVHARLDERFRILTGGTRAVLRRHQTLRAALEWSHNLVSADEQVVFRRLGVFVGGFTLELAQDVVADERIDRWAVLDLLGQLVDKSLVVADGVEVPRYRLVETMRMFALEHLAAAGETLTLLRRHAEALLAFLVPVDDKHWTWTMLESLRHAAELDNLRAALTWAESRDGDRALACALIGSSRRVWMASDCLNEGIERACRLMPLPDGLATEAEARFHMALGALGYMSARRECFVAAARAAQLYRSLAHKSRLTDALIAVALIGARRGEADQAAAAIAEADH